MKHWNSKYILLVVLLAMLMVFVPVLAQEEEGEDPVEPVEYEETGTLYVPDSQGSTTVTKDYVYVTGEEDPGIDMTAAEGQNVSATVNGEVISYFGGANVSAANGGTATLTSGNIRGGYGVWGFLNGGSLTAETGDIFAENGTALDLTLPGTGTLNVKAGDISANASGVALITGVNDENYDSDPIEGGWLDPEDGDWDEISENTESGEDDTQTGENDPLQPSSGTSKSEISVNSVEAMQTGVDIDLVNASTVNMTSEEGVFSEDKGVEIELSNAGGTVSLDTPIIEARNQGLLVNADAGTVTVKADDYISADSAVELTNNGGTVKLEGKPYLEGNSGIYVETTSGETTTETSDINAQSYGIQVLTHEYDDSAPFEPDESESSDAGEDSSASGSAPVVKITVDGDITDNIDYTMPEVDWDVDPVDPELPEIESGTFDESSSVQKSEEDSESADSVGILVNAEKESEISIDVTGGISMSYGNEIEAFDGSLVNVSVGDLVTTDYGNRLAAYDGSQVQFIFKDEIDAGGNALDLIADNGEMVVNVNGAITTESTADGDSETSGITAYSANDGKMEVTVGKGITVNGKENSVGAAIIDEGATSLKVSSREAEEGIKVSGSSSVGISVISTGTTNLEVYGDVTGAAKGLVVNDDPMISEEGLDITTAKMDILVSGTISGSNQSFIVGKDVTSDQLSLTTWKIALNGDTKAAKDSAGNANEDVEKNIKYIIKIDPKFADQLEAVKEDGTVLEQSHDYPVALLGEKIYVRAKDGSELTEVYNGKEKQTLLEKDDNGFYLMIPAGGAVWLTEENSGPEPGPVTPDRSMNFYRIGDLSWLMDVELPSTGFSASHAVALPERPEGLDYEGTGFTLQLPTLDVMESIVIVPEIDKKYPVEWLDRTVGLLDRSSLPGEGVTVLTGHNHLNTTETGPFLFIGQMEEGDRIMVTDAENNLQIYKVYGNYRIASNGFAEIADDVRENALVLITCEDESIDGGYINRRVIMAEPL